MYTIDKMTLLFRKVMGVDRRVVFRDLSKISPNERAAKSRVINFYSSVDNVGNYLPVLAIHKSLNQSLDCWNVHDRSIDFEFINNNYRCAIVGGAGLLHQVFANFWNQMLNKCEIPFIVWGVGGCFPDRDKIPLDVIDLMSKAVNRAELINIRDEFTARFFGINDYYLTACPTLGLLQDYKNESKRNITSKKIIYSPHEGLITPKEDVEIRGLIKRNYKKYALVDNIQRKNNGLWDIIKSYLESELVITSRLHGAIIAWSLDIPFVALSRDEKMREFGRLYAPNRVTSYIDEMLGIADKRDVANNAFALNEVKDFTKLAVKWVYDYANIR